jgi:peptide-methionine (R)-S-oxide reductase
MATKIPDLVYPALGITRVVIGAGLLVSPVGLARGLGIDAQTARRVGWMARIAGAREVAIGLGTLRAWRRDEPMEGWIAAQAISDGVDAVAFAVTAARGDVGPARGWGLAAFAASGAISEVLMVAAMRTAPQGHAPGSSSERGTSQD